MEIGRPTPTASGILRRIGLNPIRRAKHPLFLPQIAAAAICALVEVGRASAQDLEPRIYSAAPVGVNFFSAGYAHTAGTVSLNPPSLVTNVTAELDGPGIGYDRTFDFAGQTARIGLALPYRQIDVSAVVRGHKQQFTRSGLGDFVMRFGLNLIGNPAISPAEFEKREPTTTIGAGVIAAAPTGDYDPSRLINTGSNRWSVKPEIGLEQPWRNWFLNATAGPWIFGDNTNSLGGNVLGQEPLWVFQAQSGYTFRPSLWLAANATFYAGGETTLNGAHRHDAISGARGGLTFAMPLVDGFSMKFAWSTGSGARAGANVTLLGATLQYRWFDQ